MNITVEKVICFGIGAVIGAVVSHIGTKKYLESEIMAGLDEFVEEFPEKLREEFDKPLKRDARSLAEYRKRTRAYRDYSNPDNLDVPGEEDSLSMKEIADTPYIIDSDAFHCDMLHYDKLTITYYEGDNVVVDDQEEIITDPDSVIGSEALVNFGNQSMDPEVVYIRNEQLSVDYEITRLLTSYQPIIEPPKTKRRKRPHADE